MIRPRPPIITKKIIVCIAVVLVIAAIHIFRAGTHFSGRAYILYYSFFSDIFIPVGLYFLLCINEHSFPILRDWKIKASIVFIAAAITEIAQFFGIPIFGATFDPLDFVMFAIGVFLAVGLDKLFARILPFWSIDYNQLPTEG